MIMKRKFNLKMIILTSIFAVSILFLGTTSSKAVLQANPTTHASPAIKIGPTWMNEVRKMETVGQTMGLTETLNGLESTSGSNNIDVHMMLPTEHATIAILSVSGYGNPGKLLDETDPLKRTTTGNSTGVYYYGERRENLASFRGGGSQYSKYNFEAGTAGTLGSNLAMSLLTFHSGSFKVEGDTHAASNSNYGYLIGDRGLFSWYCAAYTTNGYGGWGTSRTYATRGICVSSDGI